MKRDIGQELLEGIQGIKQGEGKRKTVEPPPDVKTIRSKIGLSQSAFAGRLGVSVRTFQEWEQGRRTPKVPDRHCCGLPTGIQRLYLRNFHLFIHELNTLSVLFSNTGATWLPPSEEINIPSISGLLCSAAARCASS